jgi:hypothetical protein
MEIERAVCVLGGCLFFAGLVLYMPSGLNFLQLNPQDYRVPAFVIGGIAFISSCGLILFLVENGRVVFYVGIVGAAISYLFTGGILGVVGGLLGLIGGYEQMVKKRHATSKESFQEKSLQQSSETN